MLSSVDVRAQISSIIDALSKAAVAEIAKVFEDGLVVLRLEVCQRDSEINKLKTNLEVLHNELRSAQERVLLKADSRCRDGEVCSFVRTVATPAGHIMARDKRVTQLQTTLSFC